MNPTTLRALHHGTGFVALAAIGATVWFAWSAPWSGANCALVVLASVVALNMLLMWLQQGLDRSADKLDADLTIERIHAHEQVDDDRPASKADPLAIASVLLSRRFLPVATPPGWSKPLNPAGSRCWHLSAGREKVLVSQDFKDAQPHMVNAYILPPTGSKEPVSTSRCHEILDQLNDVQEWFEMPVKAEPRRPTLRAFFAPPIDLKLKQTAKPRPPVERIPLSRWLEAVRARHLPHVLPGGWSIPVAVPEHDVWMFEADDVLVMIGYCIDSDRSIKLSVMLVSPDVDNPVVPTTLLGHMRNVQDFVPTHIEEPGTVMYLGEVIGGDLPLQAPPAAAPAAPN